MTEGPSPPSGRPEPSKRRDKSPRPAPILLVMYLLATALAIRLFVTFPTSITTSISYSDFIQMVRTNQIAEVLIDEHRIRGTIKDKNQAFETTRIEDPRLLEELEQHGVKFTGETGTTWWSNLTGWLLPLILMILVWNLVLRRINPGQGAMAFERSRAKIYAEDDVKVTFADVAGIDEATEELREIVEFLQHPTKYTNLGGRIPKGVLLLGPPEPGRRSSPVLWRAKPTSRSSA